MDLPDRLGSSVHIQIRKDGGAPGSCSSFLNNMASLFEAWPPVRGSPHISGNYRFGRKLNYERELRKKTWQFEYVLKEPTVVFNAGNCKRVMINSDSIFLRRTFRGEWYFGDSGNRVQLRVRYNWFMTYKRLIPYEKLSRNCQGLFAWKIKLEILKINWVNIHAYLQKIVQTNFLLENFLFSKSK